MLLNHIGCAVFRVATGLLTFRDLYTSLMSGYLRGAESAFNRSDRNAEQHSAHISLTQLLKTNTDSEFAYKMLDRWEHDRGITINFLRP